MKYKINHAIQDAIHKKHIGWTVELNSIRYHLLKLINMGFVEIASISSGFTRQKKAVYRLSVLGLQHAPVTRELKEFKCHRELI